MSEIHMIEQVLEINRKGQRVFRSRARAARSTHHHHLRTAATSATRAASTSAAAAIAAGLVVSGCLLLVLIALLVRGAPISFAAETKRATDAHRHRHLARSLSVVARDESIAGA